MKAKMKKNCMKMERAGILFCLWLVLNGVVGAQDLNTIRDMRWGSGDNIIVTMENDSGYVLDINSLFHSEGKVVATETYTHYPVVLGENFINQLKEKNISTDTLAFDNATQTTKYKTLWSGVHATLGGGWVHFVNCMLYSLESGQLQLTAPLLKRPVSNWKPKPMTESYKRTRKWEYYVPVSQKQAIKEYKIREKEGKLGDLVNIPNEYIDLFLATNDREYDELIKNRAYLTTSKIDLVKVLLGAQYLGIPQIHFIKSMMLKSVVQYSLKNPVPSVIIFDDIQAAVAMRLDLYGYHIEGVAFKNAEWLSEPEYDDKMKLLQTIVSGINEMNMRLFEERLGRYYH
jgi:hypothetical protein